MAPIASEVHHSHLSRPGKVLMGQTRSSKVNLCPPKSSRIPHMTPKDTCSVFIISKACHIHMASMRAASRHLVLYKVAHQYWRRPCIIYGSSPCSPILHLELLSTSPPFQFLGLSASWIGRCKQSNRLADG